MARNVTHLAASIARWASENPGHATPVVDGDRITSGAIVVTRRADGWWVSDYAANDRGLAAYLTNAEMDHAYTVISTRFPHLERRAHLVWTNLPALRALWLEGVGAEAVAA